jgi:PilZ domain
MAGGSYPEKRRALRIQPYVVPCRFVEGTRRRGGYVVELSVDGLRVACEGDPPPVHSQVVIEVRLDRKVRHTRLPGEVRWVQRNGNGGLHAFGMTFEGISEDEQRTVEAVVQEFQRRVQEIEG